MSLAFFVSDTAEGQITRAKAWYEVRSPGLGDAFVQDLDRSFAAIRAFPKRAPLIRGTLRQMPATRFPYVIMYQVDDTRIVILRIVHQRRHPRHRLGRSRSR